jgi:Xaa-Pro aminopeptidase
MGAAHARPVIQPERYGERLARATAATEARGAAALLLGVGADLRYLTGYNAHLSERLTLLVVPNGAPPFLVAPRLEAMKAAACPAAAAGPVEVVTWDETDDAAALVAEELERRTGGDVGGTSHGTAGAALVSSALWALHVLALQRVLPGREFGLATAVLRDLRMVKDADEIELLRLAAEAADRAMVGIANGPLIGRTEADVSGEIRERLIAEGHDEAGFAIVASGPNGASPHHEAGDRLLRAGEPVVLDIGGTLGGYASDTTRTIWIEGPNHAAPPTPEYRRVHELVRAANEAGTSAARVDAGCASVDAVARDIIEEGGYGPQFLHRLGHGIGLEGHEEPYLVAGNDEPLRAGVSFSIEPGIYLEGRFGVRIEDIVVCGDPGPVVLNRTSHEVWTVPG